MTKSMHCLISGKVQGVFFRAWVFDQARALGLSGWVRNLDDSRVEVLAQGNDEPLGQLKDRLRRGSPLSRVETFQCSMMDYEKAYTDFNIR